MQVGNNFLSKDVQEYCTIVHLHKLHLSSVMFTPLGHQKFSHYSKNDLNALSAYQ